MAVFDWPSALAAAEIAFNPRGMSLSGPRGLTGSHLMVESDAGFWIATVSLARIGQGAPVNAFRALWAKLRGGAHHLRVPAHDQGQAPWVNPGGQSANELADNDFTDGTHFTDDTAFYNPAIVVTLKTAAALNAVTIEATVTTAGTIAAGMLFSIGDRMHVIQEVLAVSGSDQTWAIWPWLRAPAAAGIRLDFERPVCRMKLAGDDAMDLPLGRLWQSAPSMTLVEAI